MARDLMPLASSVVLVTAASCMPPPPIPRSCSDADASSCFSNAGCEGSYHCTLNPLIDSRTLVAVTCCEPGERGTGEAGAKCKSMDDCASGVCTYTTSGLFCSAACTTDAECSMPLPRCIALDPTDAGLTTDHDAGTVTFCGIGR